MFIGRKDDGSIYGLWTVKQWEGQEELPDDHPDVVAFIAAQEAKRAVPAGDPAEKLRAYLAANPDVAEMVGNAGAK